jgi:DNA-binding CsgD family transcriptional regulator
MGKEKLTRQYLQKLHAENLKKMKSNIGSVVGSTVGDKKAYLEKCVQVKSPRTIMYVYDMVQSKLTWYHGLKLLGFSKLDDIGFFDIASRYHENHQLLLWYQALKVQEIFLDYKGRVMNQGVYFVCRRAIKDADGKYWNCHYVGQAMDYDKDGAGVSYFSRWHLLNEYQGEGLTSEFVYEGDDSEKYAPMIRELNLKLETIKAFRLLGFTRMQREVIKYLAQDCSNKELAEILELSKSGIEYHNENILKIGREIFPINSFKQASDVAIYLRKQNLI